MSWDEPKSQTLINTDPTEIDLSSETLDNLNAILGKHPRTKYFYNTASKKAFLLTYRCTNEGIDADEADLDWEVWKLVYDANNNLENVEGPRLSTGGVVAVAALDALAWNI